MINLYAHKWILTLSPLISCICCSLICHKIPLSLPLPFTVCNKLCTFSQFFWNISGQILHTKKFSLSILQSVCFFPSEAVSFSGVMKFWVTLTCVVGFSSRPSDRNTKLRSLPLEIPREPWVGSNTYYLSEVFEVHAWLLTENISPSDKFISAFLLPAFSMFNDSQFFPPKDSINWC